MRTTTILVKAPFPDIPRAASPPASPQTHTSLCSVQRWEKWPSSPLVQIWASGRPTHLFCVLMSYKVPCEKTPPQPPPTHPLFLTVRFENQSLWSAEACCPPVPHFSISPCGTKEPVSKGPFSVLHATESLRWGHVEMQWFHWGNMSLGLYCTHTQTQC